MVLTPLRAYFETLLANIYLFSPRPAIKIKTSEESNDSGHLPRLASRGPLQAPSGIIFLSLLY